MVTKNVQSLIISWRYSLKLCLLFSVFLIFRMGAKAFAVSHRGPHVTLTPPLLYEADLITYWRVHHSPTELLPAQDQLHRLTAVSCSLKTHRLWMHTLITAVPLFDLKKQKKKTRYWRKSRYILWRSQRWHQVSVMSRQIC